MYSICYYCGEKEGSYHLLEETNGSEPSVSSCDLSPRNFKNFYGHTFKVGYIDSFPCMWCNKTANLTYPDNTSTLVCTTARGIEVLLLEVMKATLNFTYDLVPYQIDYLDNHKNMDKIDNDIDFVIGGISVTATRTVKMSFTDVIMFQPYHFVFRHEQPELTGLFAVLTPFHYVSWILVAIAISMYSSFLYVSINAFNDGVFDKKYPFHKCLYVSIIHFGNRNH